MTRRALLAVVIVSAIAAGALAQGRPTRHVVDRAGVISEPRLYAFHQKLAEYKRATTNEIVVYVDRALPPDTTIESFANATFNAWGLGQVGKNNGVLFVLFTNDRLLRIEVGDGLRSQLTDDDARTILASIRPMLRREEYASAIEAATDAMIRELGGVPAPKPVEAMNVREQLAARKAAGNAASSLKPLPRVSHRTPMSPGCAIFTAIFGLVGFAYVVRWAKRRALRRWTPVVNVFIHDDRPSSSWAWWRRRRGGSRRDDDGGVGGGGIGGGGRSSGGGASGDF